MARRTKLEALATRARLLDEAERLFVVQGVSRTTLQHIASAAGVTRGAIYWHFQDKAALFNAMMERAKMPLEEGMQLLDAPDSADPLGQLRDYVVSVFDVTVDDPIARRVFEIATHKTEMIDELMAVRERHMQSHAKWMARAESRLALAQARGQLRPGLPLHALALSLWGMMDGVIRIWLLNPQAFDLRVVGREMVDAQFQGFKA